MPLLALLAIFIVVPLVELYLILQIGDSIGWLPTLALLVADSLLGSLLLRSQGRAVWARFTETMAQGRVPQREVLDGVLVIFGGAFLITPGFVTDILGLLLLLPPTRGLIRRVIVRRLGRRVVVEVAGAADRRRPGGGPPRGGRDYDVEGSATEHDSSDSPRLER
jgi:UPF0716 protein FxsA